MGSRRLQLRENSAKSGRPGPWPDPAGPFNGRRAKHAIPLRDRARRIRSSHYLCHQIVVGSDSRGPFPAGEAICARQWLCRQAGGLPDLAHRRRKNRAGAVRPGRGGQQVPRSLSARSVARPAAARRLSLRQHATRCAACDACLRARQLSLQPLPQGGRARCEAGAARRRRCQGYRADRGGRGACPRPHQHAVERHGAGGARARPPTTSRRALAPASAASKARS